jgi:magnesium-transporting ATPase (P-type)
MMSRMLAGTEVAKEAADIIILDDNFSSIVKSVLWGRCVYINIRKFLVFQLSINLVAMLSAAIGALYGGVPPLNVLQLLWGKWPPHVRLVAAQASVCHPLLLMASCLQPLGM